MATISPNLGKTEVTGTARAQATKVPPQIRDLPGGLYPLKLSVYELDEWRIYKGWPMEVPPYDVHATTLVSASGEVLATRETAHMLKTGALVRWIADSQYYDVTDLRWRPIQDGAPLEWVTSPEFAPALINDYEYRVGSERFVKDAINFDSDTRDHFWMDLTGALPVSGFTVIMVMSPISAYGNDQTVPYNGLWCFGEPTPPALDTFAETAATYINVELQGNYVYLDTEQAPRAKTVGLSPYLTRNAPMYLAFTLRRPQAVVYAASGPANIASVSCPTGTADVSLDPSVVLGRSTGDVLHTADMALFDLSIYPGPLTDAQVHAEISLLASVYGGDT